MKLMFYINKNIKPSQLLLFFKKPYVAASLQRQNFNYFLIQEKPKADNIVAGYT